MFKDKEKYFQIEEFEKYGVTGIFTTKEVGNVNNFLGNSNENLKNIFDIFKISDKKIVFAKQSHTDKIIDISKNENNFYFEDVDGFITQRKDIILVTKHADCLPIYFYDIENKVIGLCHSGWKGSFQKIGLKTLELMKEKYNSKIENIIIAIGIGISCKNYKVGNEFYNMFKENFSENILKKSFVKFNEKWHFDNYTFNKELFVENNIPEKNIILSNQCTFENKRFHSFRRDKNKERNIAILCID